MVVVLYQVAIYFFGTRGTREATVGRRAVPKSTIDLGAMKSTLLLARSALSSHRSKCTEPVERPLDVRGLLNAAKMMIILLLQGSFQLGPVLGALLLLEAQKARNTPSSKVRAW